MTSSHLLLLAKSAHFLPPLPFIRSRSSVILHRSLTITCFSSALRFFGPLSWTVPDIMALIVSSEALRRPSGSDHDSHVCVWIEILLKTHSFLRFANFCLCTVSFFLVSIRGEAVCLLQLHVWEEWGAVMQREVWGAVLGHHVLYYRTRSPAWALTFSSHFALSTRFFSPTVLFALKQT